jgi:hypothetical protein
MAPTAHVVGLLLLLLLQVLIPNTEAVYRKLHQMEDLKVQAVESEIRVLVSHGVPWVCHWSHPLPLCMW